MSRLEKNLYTLGGLLPSVYEKKFFLKISAVLNRMLNGAFVLLMDFRKDKTICSFLYV